MRVITGGVVSLLVAQFELLDHPQFELLDHPQFELFIHNRVVTLSLLVLIRKFSGALEYVSDEIIF